MAKQSKSNQAERIRAVERLIAAQMTTGQIRARISEQFGVSERTVTSDIARAYELMAAEEEEQRPRRRAQMRQSLRTVFQRAIQREDMRTAVQALDRMAKLDGLYAPEQFELRHGGELTARIEAMTSEQQRARIRALVEKARGGR